MIDPTRRVVFRIGIIYTNRIAWTWTSLNKQTSRQFILTKQFLFYREFITSIAKFQKILIAGVHGHTVGIGVTILPLFDIIYAANKSTFSTPYVKIGQVPENGATFVRSSRVSHRLVSYIFGIINS